MKISLKNLNGTTYIWVEVSWLLYENSKEVRIRYPFLFFQVSFYIFGKEELWVIYNSLNKKNKNKMINKNNNPMIAVCLFSY